MGRRILHVDLDSFYASLEEQRHPELAGLPVVVCMFSGRGADAGAVATANYPARALGIRSGMPIIQAKRLGKDKAAFLPADRPFYQQISGQIMDLLRTCADRFEQVSIDEAYLEVTAATADFTEAQELAKRIKAAVYGQHHLTCSIGIGPNKLLAKMASKLQKPDGLTVITADDVTRILHPLPVEKLFGIGGKTTEILKQCGITTISDLAEADLHLLQQLIGQHKAVLLHNRAKGIDDSPVEEAEKQQLSRLASFPKDTSSWPEIEQLIERLSTALHQKVVEHGVQFKTISIIAILPTLDTITKSKTVTIPTNRLEDITGHAKTLMTEFLAATPTKLRRCGVRVSNFAPLEQRQKKLAEFS